MSEGEGSGGAGLSLAGPCPYLADRGPWVCWNIEAEAVSPAWYEEALESGWRRSGSLFYKNACPGCRSCVPIRIGTATFKPSPSQRKVLERNADLRIELSRGEYREDRFLLYSRYSAARHGGGEESGDGREAYRRFLIESPVPTLITDYYFDGPDGPRLVGNGYLDELPAGLSSVYFAFDPNFSKRSLGVFSVLAELDLCREMEKSWYYLGFWVEGSKKMAYKARYRPHELAPDGRWEATT
jgi:leucyl-tRNA---protein transferase